MAHTMRRQARKPHQCGSCLGSVSPGSVYLVHTIYPGNDVHDVPRPERLAECAGCATRHGRAELLEAAA